MQEIGVRTKPGVRTKQSFGLIALGVVLALGTGACLGGGAGRVGAISSVTYTQTKAVPDYDTSLHKVTSPARLAKLRSVLQHDGWTPQRTTKDLPSPPCPGSTATTLKITFAGGRHSTISVAPCGSQGDALSNDLTALVDRWHKNAFVPQPTPPSTTKR